MFMENDIKNRKDLCLRVSFFENKVAKGLRIPRTCLSHGESQGIYQAQACCIHGTRSKSHKSFCKYRV